ncbi:MAG TPA: M23 family metallopeptidase [Candidatus Saccharibacteria bacterium]|nr:M23 family metallopeptidase [Candidatus Saccharibacteria bacterium]
MNISKQTKSGFAVVELIIILVVIMAIGGAGYYVFTKRDSKTSNSSSTNPDTNTSDTTKTSNASNSETSSKEAKIKHLGVELDYYDAGTNKAGDFVFTKEVLSFDRLFFDFGFTVPANSAGPEKKNPQPTFIVPLGTKVHSLVDGVVYDVPKLYSDDYSVQVQGEGSELLFETEHVINVTVKKGDKVKAGDVIAEVSDYDAKNYAGLGLVEIGILKGGDSGPPKHFCPFDYLDDSIKDDLLAKITAFQKSWEEYRGDATIYDETNYAIPGCIMLDPIEG